MRTRRILASAAAAALLLAACGGDDGADGDVAADTAPTDTAAADTPEATEPTDPDAEAPDVAATVAVASTELGDVLVDGEGRTLYLFDNDSEGSSACSGDCAARWPPLIGEPSAGDGADASLLGTIERDDGTVQVTYAGHPLYRFAADSAPGDTQGQAVGDVWWVVAPDGEAVRGDGSSAGNGYGY